MKHLKKQKKVFTHLPIYNSWVVALLGVSGPDARQHVKKEWNVDVEFDTPGKTTLISKGQARIAIIHMETWNNNPGTLALFGHEVIHSCLLILRYVNQGVDTDDHEHFTYLFQYVFGDLLEKRRAINSFKIRYRRSKA